MWDIVCPPCCYLLQKNPHLKNFMDVFFVVVVLDIIVTPWTNFKSLLESCQKHNVYRTPKRKCNCHLRMLLPWPGSPLKLGWFDWRFPAIKGRPKAEKNLIPECSVIKSHKHLKTGLYKRKHHETLTSTFPSPANNTSLTGLIYLDPLVKIAKDKEDFTGRLNKYQILSLSAYLHISHLLSFELRKLKGVRSGADNFHFPNSPWIAPRSFQ